MPIEPIFFALFQLPLETTHKVDTDLILNTIQPSKDVDGYVFLL